MAILGDTPSFAVPDRWFELVSWLCEAGFGELAEAQLTGEQKAEKKLLAIASWVYILRRSRVQCCSGKGSRLSSARRQGDTKDVHPTLYGTTPLLHRSSRRHAWSLENGDGNARFGPHGPSTRARSLLPKLAFPDTRYSPSDSVSSLSRWSG